MINLLPLQEKKQLLAQQNKKLILVLAFIVLVSLLSFALILLSVYFYLLAQTSYYGAILQSTKAKYETADFLHYKTIITQSNQALAKANTFYKKELVFSNALKVISRLQKPGNLRFTNITMEPVGAYGVAMGVSGLAGTRESLLALKETLEKEPEATRVYFAPENWIKSKDINFHFTLEISAIDDAKEPQ